MQKLNTLLNEVNKDRLMEYVKGITQYVRMSGTKEDYTAFEYIKKTLESSGLSTELHSLRAYISLPVNAGLKAAGEDIPCTTHSMLPSAELNAKAVYLENPAGISAADIKGKIVITDGLAMYAVMLEAEKAGALGMVFIAGSKYVHEMIVSGVWGSPEPCDLDKYIKIPAVSVCYTDGEKLKELIRKDSDVYMKTVVDTGWADIPNLTADIKGESEDYLIFTGHVDSWHYGAMDNASGNACAMEIARILNAHKSELKRSIKFVFWSGHSHGRYAGSTAFCDMAFQDLYDHCFMHINADCLGGCGANLLSQGGCTAETWKLGSTAIKEVTGEEYEGTRFTRSCDQSFWGTGTPALFSSVSEQLKPEKPDAASKAFSMLFGGSKSGGYGWWWHTVADTCENIDPEILKRDSKIFMAAAWLSLTSDIIPVDITAGFDELAGLIDNYAKLAGSSLDFKAVLNETAKITELLKDYKRKESVNPERTNRFIIEFENILTPLRYVKGDRFHHDAAVKQMQMPILEEIHFIANESDNHKKETYVVLLRRRLNKLLKELKQITQLVENFYAGK